MRKLKIAKICWRDATHYRYEETIAWFKENSRTTNFITVGHILKMGRKDIVVALEVNEEGRARDVSIIPRSVVTKIEYLTDKGGEK